MCITRKYMIEHLKTTIQLLKAQWKESRSKISYMELTIKKQAADNKSLKLSERKFIVEQLAARD